MPSRKLLSTLVLGSLLSGCASLPTQDSEVMSRQGGRSGGFTANLVVEPNQTNEGSIDQTNQNNDIETPSDLEPTSAPPRIQASSRGSRGPRNQQPPAPQATTGNFNQTATLQQANVVAQGLGNGSNGNSSGASINVVWQPQQSNAGSISQDNQNNSIGTARDQGGGHARVAQPEPLNPMSGSSSGSSFNQTATLQQANVIIQDSTLPSQQNRNTTRSSRGSRR